MTYFEQTHGQYRIQSKNLNAITQAKVLVISTFIYTIIIVLFIDAFGKPEKF